MRKIHPKASPTHQIGIAEDSKYYCLVYFNEKEEKIIWQEKPVDLDTVIKMQSLPNANLIRPIPHQYIWRKYFIATDKYDQTTLHKQALQMIKKSLPIPLKDIYFDITITPMVQQNLNRIAVYALRKSFADPLILNKLTILDCELHCWQRGIHFLLNHTPINDGYICYLYQDKYFSFEEKELIFHSENIENSLSIKQVTYDQDIINPELYILALGAALWKK